jgi:hypothetical protein
LSHVLVVPKYNVVASGVDHDHTVLWIRRF